MTGWDLKRRRGDLGRLIGKRRMSQAEFAARLEVSPTTIYRQERRYRAPVPAWMRLATRGLEVELQEESRAILTIVCGDDRLRVMRNASGIYYQEDGSGYYSRRLPKPTPDHPGMARIVAELETVNQKLLELLNTSPDGATLKIK